MSEAPAQAPALGYSILANIGDNRQVTVQCFADSDAPLEAIHAAIDKAMAVVDRQRARYEIKELLAEREKHQQSLGRARDDVMRLNNDYQAGVDQERAHLASLGAEIETIHEQAQGRGRSFPVGADGARARALKAEQAEIVNNRDRMEAERKQALTNYAVSENRFEEAIAELDLKIAAARALLGEG